MLEYIFKELLGHDTRTRLLPAHCHGGRIVCPDGGVLKTNARTASIILAAGRGSRMKEYSGNKTLLPLVSGRSPFEGSHPILLNILTNLPAGPQAVVVNYKKEDVMEATRGLDIIYCEQPELNGTGGGLIAAWEFLKKQACDQVIITMGDVPLVRKATYRALLNFLKDNSLVILGFRPESKKQYGLLEVQENRVTRILEWKYWQAYPEDKRQALKICNAGIYAAKTDDLLYYLSVLASRPHKVHKEIDGKQLEVEEFFLTDIVEYMSNDGLSVGYMTVENEGEVMGVDDLNALVKAQKLFSTGLP
jgi:bifunctional UDP-N-acetylglucosamine pyrophosphorylase/glucosamine-1-phosphate N-acetyltransferase